MIKQNKNSKNKNKLRSFLGQLLARLKTKLQTKTIFLMLPVVASEAVKFVDIYMKYRYCIQLNREFIYKLP